MYLSNIKLWNFRRFGTSNNFSIENPNLNLNLGNGLNVLIGENDSGKTAIIDAIKLVLKTHSFEWLRVNHDDFYLNSNRLRIELYFIELSNEEAKNFTEWLGWEGTGEDAKPYLRLIYDVSRNINDNYIFPSDVKAGVDEVGYQLTAEAREYLKTTYLKPLRDAYAELVPRKNSRLSQILQSHEAFKGKNENHMLVKLFQDFNQSVENYFEGKTNDEQELEDENKKGKELKEEIDKYIQAFYDKEKESNFGVVGGSLKNILEKLELSIKDEINPGLGTLNRLFMASELLHLQKRDWCGLRIGLIEELEAHLHPQAQMQIIEALQNESNIQFILTTHSPNLGSKIPLENLILCSNSKAFPLGSDYTKLNPNDYKFLEKFLDTTKANLFFAKGVILVEGWAEEILIPSIAKMIGINLTEKGISIVNIGHTGFDHFAKIYLRQTEPYMEIPVAIITDSDIREYDKTGADYVKRESATILNETQQAINNRSSKSEQNVKYFIAPNWTLEYSLYKSTTLTTLFKNVVTSIHTGTDWNADFEKELAKKLISKTLKKTEIAYKLAHKIEETGSTIDNSESAINYLIDAIKYVCND